MWCAGCRLVSAGLSFQPLAVVGVAAGVAASGIAILVASMQHWGPQASWGPAAVHDISPVADCCCPAVAAHLVHLFCDPGQPQLFSLLPWQVKEREDLDRHRSMSKKKREGTVKIKSAAGGKQTREALLESKTHRRISRRMVSCC